MSEPVNVTVPTSIVALDHRLEQQAQRSAAELIELRWHWTLDESNPKRVLVRLYAKAVGLHPSTIDRYARAHKFIATAKRPEAALERAALGAEAHEAATAVAEARGITPSTVRGSPQHLREVREVRVEAARLAERNRTTVSEELPRAAKAIVGSKQTRAQEREDRVKRHGMRWAHISGYLDSARRDVVRAIDEALVGGLDAEERELLLDDLAKIQEACRLAREAIVGRAVDSRKLEVLKGGIAS